MPTTPSPRLFLRLFVAGALIQSALILAALLRIPSETSSARFLGLTTSRLVVVAGMGAFLLLLAGLLIASWLAPARVEGWATQLAGRLSRPRVWGWAFLLSFLVLLGGSIFAAETGELTEPFTRAIFERLLPLALWAAGLAAQVLIVLAFIRTGGREVRWPAYTWLVLIALAAFAIILLLWGWAARTILPQESARTGWYSLGVPLLEWQVFLAGLVGLGFLWLPRHLGRRAGVLASPHSGSHARSNADVIIALLLWAGSVVLWAGEPLIPSWFVSNPRAPNQEFYPYSDALLYDATAQNLLVGEGLWFGEYPFIRRPIHALYLAGLHLFGGQEYERVILLQIIVLALFPVLIYFLGKRLSGQTAGIMAGILIALREANAIAGADRFTAAHAKLLMADLPAALAVTAFVLAGVSWLAQDRQDSFQPILTGGLLAVAVLIRPEFLVQFFVLALVAAVSLASQRRGRRWVGGIGALLLGMALLILPWMGRNYRLTGLVFLDSPSFRAELFADRFGSPPPTTDEAPPGGIPTPMAAPTESAAPASPSVAPPSQAERPVPILGALLTHYLHSQMQTFLIMPSTFRGFDPPVAFLSHRSLERLWEECCSVQGYALRLPYWRKWDGAIPGQAWIPLGINLLLMALGIGEAWKKLGPAGLLPAAVCIAHLLVNALVRNSGGRYILPVDWAAILYFSLGLARLVHGTYSLFSFPEAASQRTVEPPVVAIPAPARIPTRKRTYMVMASFFLLGLALASVEQFFQPLFTEGRRREMVAAIFQPGVLPAEDRQTLEEFLEAGGASFAGRGLYPRFYRQNAGEPDTGGPWAARPYPRLAFYLAGPTRGLVTMPVENRTAYFPNASDVLVFGCPDGDLLAVAVFAPDGQTTGFQMRFPLPSTPSCPLPLVEGL